jgi:hypothetical protein
MKLKKINKYKKEWQQPLNLGVVAEEACRDQAK